MATSEGRIVVSVPRQLGDAGARLPYLRAPTIPVDDAATDPRVPSSRATLGNDAGSYLGTRIAIPREPRRADARRGRGRGSRSLGVVALLSIGLPTTSCREPAPGTAPGTSTPAVADDGATAGWDYTVTVPSDLSRLGVRVCFSGSPPAAIVPGAPEAAAFIGDVRTAEGERLRAKDGAWSLDALGPSRCVDYDVDLVALTDDARGRTARRIGDSVLVRTSHWLLRPSRLPRSPSATARFVLPRGAHVSVPWPTVDGDPERYALDTTAFRWLGYTLLGRLDVDPFEHAGTAFSIARFDAPMSLSSDELRRWITDATDSVAMLYGGSFPRARMQVVVVPVEGRGGGNVYFGMAARGGGPAIYVLMDEHADGDITGGWTTVHEMLHHGMPFVNEAWMAEGWVSYYTELTRTWMGHRDEAGGWLALRDAFDRGRRGSRLLTLGETSARMHDTFAYQRVYWGGAAIAFLLDVQMRTETHGEKTFEDAMRELRSCCGDATHKWSAKALLEKLDAWYGRPIFTETAERHLRRREFPPVDDAFAALGITFDGDRVVLDDQHPAAVHRRALMAPRRSP